MQKKRKTISDTKPIFKNSERSFAFLVVFIFLSLGVAVALSSYGKRVEEEVAEIRWPRSFFELELRTFTVGYPVAKMIPAILSQDRNVAVFLVAIAKKESNWGKAAPMKEGRDCFNYWGYRGPENVTDSGYSCFSSPGEAVSIVGSRIKALLVDGKLDTPRKMVVWKRGFSDDPLNPSEEKWVADVGYYVGKFSR